MFSLYRYICYNFSYVLGGLLVLLNLGLGGLDKLIIFIYDLCYNCSYVLVGLAGLLVLLNLGLGGLYKLILLAVLSGTVL
jgi:hypothetical protein